MKICLTDSEKDIIKTALNAMKSSKYGCDPCLYKCGESDRMVCCGYCDDKKEYKQTVEDPIYEARLQEVWKDLLRIKFTAGELIRLQDRYNTIVNGFKQKYADSDDFILYLI